MRRKLRGDLDTIILRALSKDAGAALRERGKFRGRSPRVISKAGRSARGPDTFSYRAGKFVRAQQNRGRGAAR